MVVPSVNAHIFSSVLGC